MMTPMKKRIKAACIVLLMGVVVLTGVHFLGGQNRAGRETTDLPALRANLREQVASGALTREEAQVRLAVATREAKFKVKAKESPTLEALGAQLREQVNIGVLTLEEAKARFAEAKKKRLITTVVAIGLLGTVADAQETKGKDYWNQFRGPRGDGTVLKATLPAEFGVAENVWDGKCQ